MAEDRRSQKPAFKNLLWCPYLLGCWWCSQTWGSLKATPRNTQPNNAGLVGQVLDLTVFGSSRLNSTVSEENQVGLVSAPSPQTEAQKSSLSFYNFDLLVRKR